ncbi:hypothetical protein HPB50_010116 [Hyalomma asiaticum]|uniref:Uncharacterized protein n=1 Tax=Hyalomma asiaticum TaxID=266040 RepID=A0ACB7RNA7_HYAAI|nr:hypothetical protein HPB50_010116 [Hyalomma asiaticum]
MVMRIALLTLPAILVACALCATGSNVPPMKLPQVPVIKLPQMISPMLPHKHHVKPDPQQVATSALGGGLVPDWARPTALLQTIVDRIRGTSRPCVGPSGIETGTCMAHFNCVHNGGVVVSSSDCLHATVCCKVPDEVSSAVSCGGTITNNMTAFRNPDYPADFRRGGLCSAEVTFGREVCQLRLDFVHFSLAPPRAEGPRAGLCDDDVFTVATGLGSTTYPSLCGQNTGQHMYVDVSEATRAVLSFSIGNEVPAGRKWHVRVNFVHCLSPLKAPESCLQYFTQPSGEFSSFNFLPNSPKQQLIADHKYSICFKKQLGFCQISVSFLIASYTPAETSGSTIGLFQMGPGTEPLTGARNCEDAYLLVPSGSNNAFLDDVTSDRFCGLGFPGGSVSSEVMPFTVSVVTSRPRGTTSGVGSAFSSRAFDGGVALSHDGRHGVPSHPMPIVAHPSLALHQQLHNQLAAHKPSTGTQVGFVKDSFSVIKHVPHNLHHHPYHPHMSLITVVQRPDLASGPGVQEAPQAPEAFEASNPHVGGFRLRYLMNHCN